MENEKLLSDLLAGQNALNNSVAEMANQIFKMDQKVDLFNHIVISNGNKRKITYERNEFFQMLYDRKDIWKPIQSMIERVLLIGALITLILKFAQII